MQIFKEKQENLLQENLKTFEEKQENLSQEDIKTLKNIISKYSSEEKKETFAEDLKQTKRRRVRKKRPVKPTLFSDTLQRTRFGAHITQYELSDLTGIPQCKISNYERGAQLPSKTNLKKILDCILNEDESYRRNRLIGIYEKEVQKRHYQNYANMQ